MGLADRLNTHHKHGAARVVICYLEADHLILTALNDLSPFVIQYRIRTPYYYQKSHQIHLTSQKLIMPRLMGLLISSRKKSGPFSRLDLIIGSTPNDTECFYL